ncbi:unnamed protein product, partial [Prunus brigantina]
GCFCEDNRRHTLCDVCHNGSERGADRRPVVSASELLPQARWRSSKTGTYVSLTIILAKRSLISSLSSHSSGLFWSPTCMGFGLLNPGTTPLPWPMAPLSSPP